MGGNRSHPNNIRWAFRAFMGACCAIALSERTGEVSDTQTVYVTTPFLEPDRCATAWVISRFVDGKAVFRFVERGEEPSGTILFDLPEATLRRDARRTTLDALMAQHPIDVPIVRRLARLVHDVEINAWARRDEPGSVSFEHELVTRFADSDSPEEGLRTCFEILDELREVDGDIEVWVDRLNAKHSAEGQGSAK